MPVRQHSITNYPNQNNFQQPPLRNMLSDFGNAYSPGPGYPPQTQFNASYHGQRMNQPPPPIWLTNNNFNPENSIGSPGRGGVYPAPHQQVNNGGFATSYGMQGTLSPGLQH